MVFDPDWVVCPGELIREEFAEWHMTDADAAESLGLTAAELDQLLHGELPVDDRLAYQLAGLFGTSVLLWQNLEYAYRRGLATGKAHLTREEHDHA